MRSLPNVTQDFLQADTMYTRESKKTKRKVETMMKLLDEIYAYQGQLNIEKL